MNKFFDETLNKLILLFVFDRMEIPLTENSIIDICTSRNDWLKYMECKEALMQLIEVNFVSKITPAGSTEVDPRDERYTITPEGRNCIANFFTRIKPHIREEITQYAKQNRMVFKRSQEYVSEYFKNADSTHTVVFKIKEPLVAQPLFEIKLKTLTRSAAVSAGKKWCEKAPQIYEYIYENLISDN